MIQNSWVKVAIVSLVFLGTYFGSHLLKRDFDQSKELLLEQIPDFVVNQLDDYQEITKKELYKGGPLVSFIHFWGTWCAPCEREFPELMQFIERFAGDEKVRFLIVAVNDEKPKVLKFLKRFKFPSNVMLAIDEDGDSMKKFGTIKVPESYLFDRTGKALTKFIGPQNWELPYFFYQVSSYLKK